MKLLAFIAGYAAAQDCTDDQRLVNGVCKAKCDLFDVSCSVKTGFNITVNDDCKQEQYSHLTFDNDYFFVNGASLNGKDGTPASDDCKFKNGKIEKLAFTECRKFPFTTGATYNTYSGWINHRIKVGNTTTSLLDEITFECNLEHVDLDSGNANNNANVNLSDNDEKTGTGEIASAKLIEDLGLKLQVGTTKNDGNWDKEVAAPIDVGTTVRVRLEAILNPGFDFALRECAAESAGQNVELYGPTPLDLKASVFCPNDNSAIVNTKFKSRTEFDINVFRAGSAKSLTFKCRVSLFPENDPDLPTCETSRKRREVAFYQRHARSAEDTEITFTIDIKDNGSSGAAKSCVNFLIPSMFIYVLH